MTVSMELHSSTASLGAEWSLRIISKTSYAAWVERIEECFGWLKTIALLRKVRHRGICKGGWIFTFAAAAYNLVRMRKLVMQVT